MSDQLSLRDTITSVELDILTAHYLRSQRVFSVAFTRVDVEQFRPNETVHKLLWAIAKEFFAQHKQMVPYEYIQQEVNRRITGHPVMDNSFFRQAVQSTLEAACSIPIVDGYAVKILQEFVTQRTLAHGLRDALEKGVMDAQIWNKLTDKWRNTTLDTAAEIAPFDPDHCILEAVKPRIPCNVGFIDKMLGGGMRTGELNGFLAASGNGKTTLGTQIALEAAQDIKVEQNIMVFSYEQPVDAEYLIPVYACATKIQRSVWERVGPDNPIHTILTEEQYAHWKHMQTLIRKRLHFIDMSGESKDGRPPSGFGGPAEIRAKIDNYEKTHDTKITAIIIDWFWPMVTRYFGRAEAARGKTLDQRTFAQAQIDELKMICSNMKVWGWLNHQLNPEAAKKKRKMSFEDAAELKSFAWFLTNCICLDKLTDDDRMGEMHACKVRNNALASCLVQLKGEVATFVSKEADMVYDEKLGKHVSKQQLNSIPRSNDTTHTPSANTTLSPAQKDYIGKLVPAEY